jgi:ABC-2 type transport system permease protein
MRVIVLINPATYFIDAVRALAFGTAATLPLWLSGLILIGFAVLSMMFALTLFQRSLRA